MEGFHKFNVDMYDMIRVNVHDRSIVMGTVAIDGVYYVRLANKMLVPTSMVSEDKNGALLVSL
jgi:hypothetical protein